MFGFICCACGVSVVNCCCCFFLLFISGVYKFGGSGVDCSKLNLLLVAIADKSSVDCVELSFVSLVCCSCVSGMMVGCCVSGMMVGSYSVDIFERVWFVLFCLVCVCFV